MKASSAGDPSNLHSPNPIRSLLEPKHAVLADGAQHAVLGTPRLCCANRCSAAAAALLASTILLLVVDDNDITALAHLHTHTNEQ